MSEAVLDIIARVLVCVMGVSGSCLVLSAIRERRFAAILFCFVGCVSAVLLLVLVGTLSKQ